MEAKKLRCSVIHSFSQLCIKKSHTKSKYSNYTHSGNPKLALYIDLPKFKTIAKGNYNHW